MLFGLNMRLRRVQFILGVLASLVVPFAIGWLRLPDLWALQGIALTGVGVAVAFLCGFDLWRRMNVFSTVRGMAHVPIAFLPSYGAVALLMWALRLDYNRAIFFTSLLVVLIVFGVLQFVVYNRQRPVLAYVPGGRMDRTVSMLSHVDWRAIGRTTRDEILSGSRPLIASNGGLRRNRTGAFAAVHGIVADLQADHDPEWQRMMALATLRGIPVHHVKQTEEEITGQVRIEHLSENAFGSLLPNLAYLKVKRVLDIVVTLLLLPVLVPLIALTALAVYVIDGKPVFFRQQRVGFRGDIFWVYKFRTMREDERSLRQRKASLRQASALYVPGFSAGPQVNYALADAFGETAPLVAPTPAATALDDDAVTSDNDDRITPLGAFLRRSRLDELPQVLNILRGEMSWIGPRPEALSLVRRYEQVVPFYTYRHAVRPGITGWAQVRQGHVTSFEGIREKLGYDYYYIKHVSAMLDMLVLLGTIRVVLTGRGAR